MLEREKVYDMSCWRGWCEDQDADERLRVGGWRRSSGSVYWSGGCGRICESGGVGVRTYVRNESLAVLERKQVKDMKVCVCLGGRNRREGVCGCAVVRDADGEEADAVME